MRPPLDDDELVRSYGYSRVSLGFSAVGEDLVDRVVQTRLRDFEAPMCGAFYLVEHFDDILECFEPGKEIATYVDADDLVEAGPSPWLRAPEAERQAIRDNARKLPRSPSTRGEALPRRVPRDRPRPRQLSAGCRVIPGP